MPWFDSGISAMPAKENRKAANTISHVAQVKGI